MTSSKLAARSCPWRPQKYGIHRLPSSGSSSLWMSKTTSTIHQMPRPPVERVGTTAVSCEAAGRQGGSAKAAAVAGGGEKPGVATSQGGPAARRTQREQLGDANARVSEAEAVGANDAKKDGKQQRRQEVVPIVAGAGERGGGGASAVGGMRLKRGAAAPVRCATYKRHGTFVRTMTRSVVLLRVQNGGSPAQPGGNKRG